MEEQAMNLVRIYNETQLRELFDIIFNDLDTRETIVYEEYPYDEF